MQARAEQACAANCTGGLIARARAPLCSRSTDRCTADQCRCSAAHSTARPVCCSAARPKANPESPSLSGTCKESTSALGVVTRTCPSVLCSAAAPPNGALCVLRRLCGMRCMRACSVPRWSRLRVFCVAMLRAAVKCCLPGPASRARALSRSCLRSASDHLHARAVQCRRPTAFSPHRVSSAAQCVHSSGDQCAVAIANRVRRTSAGKD